MYTCKEVLGGASPPNKRSYSFKGRLHQMITDAAVQQLHVSERKKPPPMYLGTPTVPALSVWYAIACRNKLLLLQTSHFNIYKSSRNFNYEINFSFSQLISSV